jgi:hypothetical protein
MSYEIFYPKVDKNKLIELGHMIIGTYPTKGTTKRDKPTLRVRNWRTQSGSSSSPTPQDY